MVQKATMEGEEASPRLLGRVKVEGVVNQAIQMGGGGSESRDGVPSFFFFLRNAMQSPYDAW